MTLLHQHKKENQGSSTVAEDGDFSQDVSSIICADDVSAGSVESNKDCVMLEKTNCPGVRRGSKVSFSLT